MKTAIQRLIQCFLNELSREQIEKAMACETAEELMAAAKSEGYELTKDEAEAYMADFELDEKTLAKAAGGMDYWDAAALACADPHVGG